MPIYEYHCDKCGEFEVTQRITEEPLQKCPTCRRKVRKLISNTSFQLKGSGWYITDYGRGGSKDKDAAGKGESGAAASKGESAPDAKSEAKSETKSESPAPAKAGKSTKKPSAKAA